MFGAETVENFYVVGDAWAQVISKHLSPSASLLDVGCGCGRTARFLINSRDIHCYIGLDVVRPFIAWCNRFIASVYPNVFSFHHMDVRTPRYNPDGTVNASEVDMPVDSDSFDLAFAASLFTHLTPRDAERYLTEIARCLKPGGLAIVSIHDQVGEGDFSGDTYRADYAPAYFLEMARRQGFALQEDLGELCGQLAYVLYYNGNSGTKSGT